MYSPRLLDHFQNPRNAGKVESPTVSVELQNPACGDVLQLSIRIAEGRIAEVRFLAKGCVPAIACASAMTELATGKTCAEAQEIKDGDILAAVGTVPKASAHAARLSLEALRKALAIHLRHDSGQ
jgi:NifU-like protein involved in Fe-S cluster formation